MPQLFKPSSRQYLWGYAVFDEKTREDFKYSIVDDETRNWYKPIKNLVGDTQNQVIMTTYDIRFRSGLVIYLNGERHKIVRCQKVRSQINETALRMWADDDSAYWVIEVR